MTIQSAISLPAVPPLVAPPSRRRRPLVAVLPFCRRQHDEGLRALGTDIADLLRETMSGAPDIGSRLIRSDFLSRAPDHALELVCRQLRVGYLVSGTCYQLGAGTSLYIELAETRRWHIVWADFIRGNARDLLQPESAAMHGVLAGLGQGLRRHQPAW